MKQILIALATLAICGAAAAQSMCPIGYYPVGNDMCCPIGTVPVMGPFGVTQCQRP